MDTNKKIGILFSYTASGELKITYNEIENLAKQCGLDTKYIPTPTSQIDTWKRSTNLTAKGKKLTPSQTFVNKMKSKYGDKSTVKLAVKTLTVCNRVSETEPKLIKHLEREVIVSQANLADRVDRKVIGEMTFDPDNRVAEFLAYPDQTGAINGDGKAILDELHHNFNDALLYVDNQHIRQGIRNFLENHFSISLRGSGGLYNIPLPQDTKKADEIKNQVLALIKFLDGLDSYRTADGEVSGLAYEIEDDPQEIFGTATKVRIQAENTMKQIMVELQKTLKEISNKDSKRGLKSALNNAQIKMLEFRQMTQIYKESVDADIGNTENSLKVMEGIINNKMMELL